jgi:uncharacterized surface protein with fasciclin (FAS1) repeats
MPHFPRLAALTAVAALTVSLAGCADEEVPPSAAPPPPLGAPPLPGEVTDPAQGVYGPGCDQVPASGEGSAAGMADDPIGTAAANNPLVSRLVEAAQAAGLVDTLNDPNASYTVFAPANTAFDALPPGTLDQLLADPQGQLTTILTYHVVPQRYDAQGLADAGTVTTVQGTDLTITGEPGSLVIDEQEQASVLCGNISTANGTVFVIDKVLMP